MIYAFIWIITGNSQNVNESKVPNISLKLAPTWRLRDLYRRNLHFLNHIQLYIFSQEFQFRSWKIYQHWFNVAFHLNNAIYMFSWNLIMRIFISLMDYSIDEKCSCISDYCSRCGNNLTWYFYTEILIIFD